QCVEICAACGEERIWASVLLGALYPDGKSELMRTPRIRCQSVARTGASVVCDESFRSSCHCYSVAERGRVYETNKISSHVIGDHAGRLGSFVSPGWSRGRRSSVRRDPQRRDC